MDCSKYQLFRFSYGFTKTAFEFENIDYQTDRDGNPKPRLIDKDNHSIDAVRYAMSEDMRSNKTKVKTFRGSF